MSWMRRAPRRLGGAIGIAVAAAGGFGAAVGVYSLPDPRQFTVAGDAYVRADQRARVRVVEEGEDGYRTMTLLASRGAGASGRGYVSDSSHSAFESHDVTTHFQGLLEVCTWEDECDVVRAWEADVPLGWFRFSPAMRNARFRGVVGGCAFDIAWTGAGAIVPGAGGEVFPSVGWGVAESHFARGPDLARGAFVDVASCEMSGEDVHGTLEQGVKRTQSNARAEVGR